MASVICGSIVSARVYWTDELNVTVNDGAESNKPSIYDSIVISNVELECGLDKAVKAVVKEHSSTLQQLLYVLQTLDGK